MGFSPGLLIKRLRPPRAVEDAFRALPEFSVRAAPAPKKAASLLRLAGCSPGSVAVAQFWAGQMHTFLQSLNRSATESFLMYTTVQAWLLGAAPGAAGSLDNPAGVPALH